MMDIVKDNISGIDTSTTFLATFAEILLKFKQEGMSSVCRIHGEQVSSLSVGASYGLESSSIGMY